MLNCLFSSCTSKYWSICWDNALGKLSIVARSIELRHVNAFCYTVSKYQCVWLIQWEIYRFPIAFFSWIYVKLTLIFICEIVTKSCLCWSKYMCLRKDYGFIFASSTIMHLDILWYGVQNVCINHPQWYYHLNFQDRVFEFLICLQFVRVFVFKRTAHVEFALFLYHDWNPYLNLVSIHYD